MMRRKNSQMNIRKFHSNDDQMILVEQLSTENNLIEDPEAAPTNEDISMEEKFYRIDCRWQ